MPELTPQQKAQLDTNIRGMLSQGASEDDVMTYANDFKLKYDPALKKKEVGGLGSKIGGQAGTSVLQSEPEKIASLLKTVRHSPATAQDLQRQEANKEKPDDLDFDEKDPIKSFNKIIFGRTTRFEQPIAESTNQNARDWESNAEIDVHSRREANKRMTPHTAAIAFKETQNEVVPNAAEARKWIFQSGKQFDEKNETDVLARDVLHEYETVKSTIANNNMDLTKAAIDYYSDKDPQLKVLKDAGRMPPESVQSDLLAKFLQDKNVKELSGESQEFHNLYREQLDNFYQNHPEQRVNKIVSQIAQGREDYGYNNPFLNLVGVKSSDKVIENLSMRGEIDDFDKDFYYKTVRPLLELHIKEIPTTGLLETAFKSTVKGFTDIPKGIYDFTLRDLVTTQADRTYQNLDDDANRIGVKPKGIVNRITYETGNIAGFLPSLAVGSSVLKGLNVLKNGSTANKLMFGVQTYHDFHTEAEKSNPGKPLENRITALTQSAVMATVADFFPKLSKDIFQKSNPTIKEVLSKLEKNEISGTTATGRIVNEVVNKAEKIVGHTLDGATKMSLASFLNEGIGGIFTGKFNVEQGLQHAAETFESMVLGMPLLNIATMRGSQRNVTGDILMDITETPETVNHIRNNITKNAELDPEFAKQAPALLERLDHVVEIRKSLEGMDLNEKQKRDFLITELQSKLLEKKIKDSPSKVLTSKEEKQLEELEINKKIILDPDISNTEIVKEFYDNELLGKGSVELLSVRDADGKPTNKFDPSKSGEYLKEVAQRTNNLDSDWKPNSVGNSSEAAKSSYPEAIVEIANKRWAKEIEAAKPKEEVLPTSDKSEADSEIVKEEGAAKVVMPEENKPPNIIELKKDATEPITEKVTEIIEPVNTEKEVITETKPDSDSEGAGGGKKPPEGGEKEAVGEKEGDIGGITHAANEIRRKERGLPEYQKNPTTEEALMNEAENRLKEGYEVEDLMNRLEKGGTPEPVENFIRKIYIATLDAEIAKNPTDALLAKQKRFAEIGDLVNSKLGLNLWSLKGEGSPLSSISDFYVAKMEAAGVDKLTDQQKKETKEAFDNVQKADANAEAAMEAYREEIAKLKAENELLKEKKNATKKTTKTKEDFVTERKQIVQSIADKWKNAGKDILSSDIPYRKQLAAIAPDVIKLVKSYATEAGIKLEEIVIKVYDELKDFIKDKKDIHDIIAGEYAEKKQTRNELAAKIRDLKDEAYYINKLERLLKGEEPKKEQKKVERNRQITDLQKKIKEFQKAERDAVPTDLKKLDAVKKRNETETEKIKERIAKGDFETKKQVPFLEDPELNKRFPKQYMAAVDALVKKDEARHEFDIALFKDQMARRTKGEIASDLLAKSAGTVKAITTGIDDSAVAIQTYMSMLVRPRTGAKAFVKHISHAVSQKRFDRWLAILHNSADFQEMKEMGLDVTEPSSLKAKEKEEIFSSRFDGTIKIKGKEYKLISAPLKPFERAFTTLGNVTRVVGYRTISAKYKREGNTIQNNPELFKSLAQRLNTETGRGKQNEYIEQASKVVTLGIWSPRLMAMKFNLLGVSDVASLVVPGTKGYYRQLHPKERLAAIKDVAQFAITVMALSYGAALAFGGDIDDDPLSSTFMDVKMPNGKSYNFTGGFSGYIRSLCQFFTGKKHKDGKTIKVSPLETGGRFFRGKVPPLTGAALNLASGKDFMGQPATVKNQAINLLPISMRGIGQQIERDGAQSFFTQGIPTFFGFNIKDESDYTPSKTIALKGQNSKGQYEERQATPEEYKEFNELKEKLVTDEMKRLENEWIEIDPFGHVSVTRKTDSKGRAKEAFEEVKDGTTKMYKELTSDQKKELEKKIKDQMRRKAVKEKFGEYQEAGVEDY